MRVLVVEDHALLAQSLAVTLSGSGVEARVATGPTPEDVVAAADEHGAELVLLDLDLGDAMGSGIDLVPRLRGLGAQVVVLTASTDRAEHAAAVEAGAQGVLTKDQPFEDLVAGIERVAREGSLLANGERDEMLAELRRQRAEERERLAAFERLTPREREVLAAICDGRSAEEMAADWVVSVATVRSQIRAVLRKLGVSSQLAAAAAARRAGWRPPEEGG